MEHEKELWGRTFKLVNKGLDEAEVYSFVEGLIGQYANVARRLEHLESVTSSLETRTADRSPDGDAQSDGSQPAPHARRTNGFGDPSELEKLENLSALTSFAERTVIEAAKHARRIETEAIQRAQAAANRIVAETLGHASSQMAHSTPQTGAGHLLPETPPSATQWPSSTIAGETANSTSGHTSPGPPAHTVDALFHLRHEIQAVMNDMATLDADLAKGALASLCTRLLPLLDSFRGDTTPPPGEGEAPAAPEHVQAVDSDEESPQAEGQPLDDADESLFSDTVELVLPPPVALDRMLQIHKRLKETPHVDVLNLGGSVDNGITIRILLDSPLPLLKMLQELPEADSVAEELPNDKKAAPARQGRADGHVRRLIIAAKD